jgi:hypothetical protein
MAEIMNISDRGVFDSNADIIHQVYDSPLRHSSELIYSIFTLVLLFLS